MTPVRTLAFLFATAAATYATAAEIVIDSPMYDDPAIELPGTVATLPPRFKTLWYEALAGREDELRMRAAEAIAKISLRGFADMSDAAPHLTGVLDDTNARLPVRLAAARALVVIDARQAAGDLLAQARRGEPEMRQVAEPALAEWDHLPARRDWLDRLNSQDASADKLLVAVRCLGQVRERTATGRLRTLAESPEVSPGLRLEAGRALAEIESAGLEEMAGRLAAVSSPGGLVDRLVAASMLKNHRDERAVALLTRLALDPEPAVAAMALQWLLDTDTKLVLPLVDRLIGNRDSKVRRLTAQSLAANPSSDAVAKLGPLLDDPHPELRRYVRDTLYTFASDPALDLPVRDAGMRELAGDGWRGPEQASILLGALDHEPAADRLVELLEHPRPEVMVASAWALRRIAVPATFEPMFRLAQRRTEELVAKRGVDGTDGQLSQIFQAFGRNTFHTADPLMRKYVPKDHSLGKDSRAAAVWALGHLHAGKPDERLVSDFQGRLKDVASIPAEHDSVRRMAAVSLARMGAFDSLPTLRAYAESNGALTEVGGACNWALTQLTGETFPRAEPRLLQESGWFLEPI